MRESTAVECIWTKVDWICIGIYIQIMGFYLESPTTWISAWKSIRSRCDPLPILPRQRCVSNKTSLANRQETENKCTKNHPINPIVLYHQLPPDQTVYSTMLIYLMDLTVV